MYRDFTELVMQVVMWSVSPVPGEELSRPRSTQRVRRVLATLEPAMYPDEITAEVCHAPRAAGAAEAAMPASARPRASRAARAPGPAGTSACGAIAVASWMPTSAYVCRQKTRSDGARNKRTRARRTMMILGLTGRAASSMYRELSVGSPCELRPRRVTGGRCASRPCRGRPAAERLLHARRPALPQRHLQTLKPQAPARWAMSCVRA